MDTRETVRLFDPSEPRDVGEIEHLLRAGVALVDTYDQQCEELAAIRDPTAVGHVPACLLVEPGERLAFFPWRGVLVRILGRDAYRELRTNRNRNLVTTAEQDTFGAARIAFAGLNVGNPGAVCIALEGGSHAMKFADFDKLSLTNLNRFRAGLPDLGINKAHLTARQVLELDPYYEIEVYGEGLSPDNLQAFLAEPGVDLVVEEMDALPLKIAVRRAARERRIPVIMVTGNGEGLLLEVERYDHDPRLPIMNGLMAPDVMNAIMTVPQPPRSPFEKIALAQDFMGRGYLDARLNESFSEFGKTLVGIPQLAESSFLRGAAVCWAAKAIILGRPLPSGRYSFSFADALTPACRSSLSPSV